MSPSSPTLQIDLASPTPVFRQIAGALRAHLVHGAFAPGDALPTVRQLAIDLGVHHNTVAEAYRLLAEEGWLDLRRRRGARVLPRPRPDAPPKAQEAFARRLHELTAEASASGLPSSAIARALQSLAKRVKEKRS